MRQPPDGEILVEVAGQLVPAYRTVRVSGLLDNAHRIHQQLVLPAVPILSYLEEAPGEASLTYASKELALAAVVHFDKCIYDGCSIRVEMAVPESDANQPINTPTKTSELALADFQARTIYVAGLPAGASDKDLQNHFLKAGSIQAVSVDSNFGTVTYFQASSVDTALRDGSLAHWKDGHLQLQLTRAHALQPCNDTRPDSHGSPSPSPRSRSSPRSHSHPPRRSSRPCSRSPNYPQRQSRPPNYSQRRSPPRRSRTPNFSKHHSYPRSSQPPSYARHDARQQRERSHSYHDSGSRYYESRSHARYTYHESRRYSRSPPRRSFSRSPPRRPFSRSPPRRSDSRRRSPEFRSRQYSRSPPRRPFPRSPPRRSCSRYRSPSHNRSRIGNDYRYQRR